MGNTDGYEYSVSEGSNDGVSVGEGGYCMEVTTPSGKTFAREGYDSAKGAESGAQQSIENMVAPSSADILEQLREAQERMKQMEARAAEAEKRAKMAERRAKAALEQAEEAALRRTMRAGILNDDGRSA